MRYVLVIAMAITLGLSTKVLDIKGAFVAEDHAGCLHQSGWQDPQAAEVSVWPGGCAEGLQ